MTIPEQFTDDKWTLGQVMAWCRQATGHYLNQCRTSSMKFYGMSVIETNGQAFINEMSDI